MNIDGIIVRDGERLSAFPYPADVSGESSQTVWRGVTYAKPLPAAEWMELVDAEEVNVGVQLDMVREYHPFYWEWLHRFQNVTCLERGDVRILFRDCNTTVREAGPYLPVEAYQATNGDFALYVPELLRA